MRTTLNIDDAALAGAMKTAPGKTKTTVINEALREYARRRRVRRFLELKGRARWDGNLDDLRGGSPPVSTMSGPATTRGSAWGVRALRPGGGPSRPRA